MSPQVATLSRLGATKSPQVAPLARPGATLSPQVAPLARPWATRSPSGSPLASQRATLSPLCSPQPVTCSKFSAKISLASPPGRPLLPPVANRTQAQKKFRPLASSGSKFFLDFSSSSMAAYLVYFIFLFFLLLMSGGSDGCVINFKILNLFRRPLGLLK